MPEFNPNGLAKKQQLEKRCRCNAMTEALPQDNNGIDDGVDDEISHVLISLNQRFFSLCWCCAGKTRSVVNAINRVRREYQRTLLLQGQRIAVINQRNGGFSPKQPFTASRIGRSTSVNRVGPLQSQRCRSFPFASSPQKRA